MCACRCHRCVLADHSASHVCCSRPGGWMGGTPKTIGWCRLSTRSTAAGCCWTREQLPSCWLLLEALLVRNSMAAITCRYFAWKQCVRARRAVGPSDTGGRPQRQLSRQRQRVGFALLAGRIWRTVLLIAAMLLRSQPPTRSRIVSGRCLCQDRDRGLSTLPRTMHQTSASRPAVHHWLVCAA